MVLQVDTGTPRIYTVLSVEEGNMLLYECSLSVANRLYVQMKADAMAKVSGY